MTRREDLEPLIIKEWLKRPLGSRTEKDVLTFYSELQQAKPELLAFYAAGDKYQVLKSILRQYIEP